MQRVGTLIEKLKNQYEQQADKDQLRITVQMILAELQDQQVGPNVGGAVSVILPSSINSTNPVIQENAQSWLYDTQASIPTLDHQDPTKLEKIDFNAMLAKMQESINENLKQEKVEIAATLQDRPIKDIKKAIGINERFQFINELFRGDEEMFERSIKTINSFSILEEAEYWIVRELKLKLSWPENAELVKQFDQLVKRRFL